MKSAAGWTCRFWKVRVLIKLTPKTNYPWWTRRGAVAVRVKCFNRSAWFKVLASLQAGHVSTEAVSSYFPTFLDLILPRTIRSSRTGAVWNYSSDTTLVSLRSLESVRISCFCARQLKANEWTELTLHFLSECINLKQRSFRIKYLTHATDVTRLRLSSSLETRGFKSAQSETQRRGSFQNWLSGTEFCGTPWCQNAAWTSLHQTQ